MTQRTLQLNDKLAEYLLKVGVTETPILKALRHETATHRLAKMQIAPEQGQLLAWLANLIEAKRYLEIGVFTGYSCLAVTQALTTPAEVIACDVSTAFTEIAKRYWLLAGVTNSIQLILQPAQLTLQQLVAQGKLDYFDIAFIDADKPSTPDYVEFCLKLVRPGGIIAIDNILSGGRVIAPHRNDPPGVHILHKFNLEIIKDPRVKLVTLPVGDGLTLLKRKY